MNRRFTIKFVFVTVIVLILSLLVAGCVVSPATTDETDSTAGEAEVERPLVVALLADPENIDPHQYDSSNAYYVISEIFEGLLRLKPGTSDLEPVLAESWEVSDDGLHYTFKLREGVTFHDGTPFNAEAAKWNADRQMDPDNPYNSMGTFFYWNAYLGVVESVEVVDEYTVRYNLSEPYAYFLNYMAGGMGMMVSPAAVEEYGEDFVQHPVGVGAYKFVEWDKGQQVVLERYEEYWGEQPAIRQVVFRPIPEEGTKITALLTDEVHLAPEIGPVAVEQLQQSEAHDVFQAPTGSIWFMSMNVQKAPFDDVRVRQAISHAVNKESIVADILKNTVEIAHGPIAPAYPCYNPDVTVYEFDPDQARALLAEAGYPDGFEVKFDVPQSGSGMQLPIEMGTAIQADLAAVGITANIETTDFNTWMDRIRTPEVDLAEMSWNVSPTVEDDILSYVFAAPGLPPEGFNTAWYSNDEVLGLLQEASQTVDLEARCELIKEAQKIITDDAPAVFVDHAKISYGLDGRLEGFNPSLEMQLNLKSVSWTE